MNAPESKKLAGEKTLDAAAPRERSGGIQSLERAFAILEVVASSRDGITLIELSKAVGLHNSTAFHLLKTMVQLGYVAHPRDSKRYLIGSRLFTLAAGALDESTLLALSTPVLEALTLETGEAAHFAIRSGQDAVVIAKTPGAGLMQMSVRTGSARPVHATALGKVLLGAMSDADLREFLDGMELVKLTPATIVDREVLLREILEARAHGVAYDDGEFNEEVRCVAVPVRDFAGRAVGAIGISAPKWRVSQALLESKGADVKKAAATLSAQLGYRQPSIGAS